MERTGVNVTPRIMPATRESPLCGRTMRLEQRQSSVLVPGNSEKTTHTASEWLCPACDYFEEVDEEGT